MADCKHCGTGFSPKDESDHYCCRGCEFVANLISEQGFEQFYDLKQGTAVTPVRSRPFEEHDFSWLDAKVAEAEARAGQKGTEARMDVGLEGISCVGCVWLVEKLFTRHPGSLRAVASPANGRLHLEWVPGTCKIGPFLQELCQFGYVAAPTSTQTGDHERRRLSARLGLCGAFALNTMAFSLPVYMGMPATFEFASLFYLIAFISATLSMLVGSGYFIGRAWRALRAGTFHIDLPIALGLIVAYAGSISGWVLGKEKLMYFDFVSTFVFLMLGGRYLQTAALDRNRKRLLRQQPVPETVPLADGSGQTIARDAIQPGSVFLLSPGQACPVSGILAEGEAEFSLEWIHGEADPVKFSTGSRLAGGAILLSRQPVAVRAEETWETSLLAKLTAHVDHERNSPGLDKLLRVYLGIVLVLGLIGLLIWGLSGDWVKGVQAMISIFVVSCPCALGVSIPFADDMAASTMERIGVFVRNATIWPRLQHIRQVVFDKTGTLTLERPLLSNPEAVTGLDDAAALALARLTRGSLHPVSRALLETLGTRGQRLLTEHGHGQATEVPGAGVILESGDDHWSLGKAGWTGQAATATPAENASTELRHDGTPVASFHFSESLRPGALEVVRHLKDLGLTLHILSGDHPEKVAKTTKLLQLDENQSIGALSPEEKAARVKSLSNQDVLYLGDGANDSLAFDAALVTGTPVVDRSLLESKADFYTLGAGLGFLPQLLNTSKARKIAVRCAFSFALVYNLTTIGFCMAGKMSPVVAAIIMPLSSVVSIAIVASVTGRFSKNNG